MQVLKLAWAPCACLNSVSFEELAPLPVLRIVQVLRVRLLAEMLDLPLLLCLRLLLLMLLLQLRALRHRSCPRWVQVSPLTQGAAAANLAECRCHHSL